MATTEELLADAQAAYHRLMTGTQVVEVHDGNGETVKYNMASAPRLLTYIQSIIDQMQPCKRINRPMRVFF